MMREDRFISTRLNFTCVLEEALGSDYIIMQICSFSHWNDYHVEPAASRPDDLTGIRINRLWSENNQELLRSKPTECRGVDELLHICIEMSKQKNLSLSERDADNQISAAIVDDRNDAACYHATSVENSTACWYPISTHSNDTLQQFCRFLSSLRAKTNHFIPHVAQAMLSRGHLHLI